LTYKERFMRRLLLPPLLVMSLAIHANDTLRVGQQVLTSGDPATHAIDLLGTPAFKTPLENNFGAYVGESWQFKLDTGRIVTVTIIGGKVAGIEESQQY
jgi:hydrogenase maturation factor